MKVLLAISNAPKSVKIMEYDPEGTTGTVKEPTTFPFASWLQALGLPNGAYLVTKKRLVETNSMNLDG